MARYFPPEAITNNAAPVLSADLAYEAHGKCGTTRVLENDRTLDGNIFDSVTEGTVNAWKIVFLNETTVMDFQTNNMDIVNQARLGDATTSKVYPAGIEIMADIKYVKIDDRADNGLAILYLDCQQS
tara:strand:+ start:539 stop:919 length:381 start_codon:yes stop_codon:yes gene_type:complete